MSVQFVMYHHVHNHCYHHHHSLKASYQIQGDPLHPDGVLSVYPKSSSYMPNHQARAQPKLKPKVLHTPNPQEYLSQLLLPTQSLLSLAPTTLLIIPPTPPTLRASPLIPLIIRIIIIIIIVRSAPPTRPHMAPTASLVPTIRVQETFHFILDTIQQPTRGASAMLARTSSFLKSFPLLPLLMLPLELVGTDCAGDETASYAEWAVADLVAYECAGCATDGCSAPFFSSALASLPAALGIPVSVIAVAGMRARRFVATAGAVAIWV